MKTKKITAALLALLLISAVVCGCAAPQETPAAEAPAAEAPAAETPAEEPAADAPAADAEPIKIGMVSPVTGTSSLVGEYMVNGFNLAADEINAAGGILGHPIELVLGDEVDNAQSSVNAMQLIISSDVTAIIGSYYSSNAIAALPDVLNAKTPTMVCGSSSGVSKESNPYAWQARPLDTAQGKALANFVVNELKCTNPAIVYSTNSALVSLEEQFAAAMGELGVTISEKNLLGHPEDESNFAPYFAQIVTGDYDCIVSLETTALAAIVCQAAETAGVDTSKLPCIGATAFSNTITIQNGGSAAEGWYSVSDWVAGGASDVSAKFEEAYQAKYNNASDLGAVVVYDSLYLLKYACETANTVTDKEAINKALESVSGMEGAMSTFEYNEDHSFSTSLMITQNKSGAAEVISVVSYR